MNILNSIAEFFSEPFGPWFVIGLIFYAILEILHLDGIFGSPVA